MKREEKGPSLEEKFEVLDGGGNRSRDRFDVRDRGCSVAGEEEARTLGGEVEAGNGAT